LPMKTEKVYIMSVFEAALIPEKLCEKLFPKRMERARQFRKRDDFLRSIAAGALESHVLGVDEREIHFNDWGKPCVNGRFFSVSHSGSFTMLAVNDCEIGVDIEKKETVRDGVARRVFTPEEIAWMNEDPEKRFFILWTLKESVCKLDGRGFSLAPESFSVFPITQGKSITIGGKELFGCSGEYEDCIFSLCSEKKIETVEPVIITAEDILTGLYIM